MQSAGLRVLEATDPEFVKAAREMVGPDYGHLNAPTKLRPLLSGKFPDSWEDLLTSVLDMELTLEKTIRAAQFTQMLPDSDDREEVGAWLTCHRDYWVLELAALVERLDTFSKKLIRFFLRGVDSSWQQKQEECNRIITRMKAHIRPVRNMIAHGSTPGVTGIKDAGLWELYLATEPLDRPLSLSAFEADLISVNHWQEYVRQDTANMLHDAEIVMKLLANYVP